MGNKFLYLITLLIIILINQIPVFSQEPSSSNILGLIRDKLAKWNSIQYTMDMDIDGKPYVYQVYYKKPSHLKTISWNKKDNSDKITMIVFKNTTTVFDHKKKDKQTFDTGSFDLFRINNDYDKKWTVQYKGSIDLTYKKGDEEDTKECWVVFFITQQGVKYKFWIDRDSGIAFRMEVYVKKGDPPFIIGKLKSFKLDAPIDDSVFKNPF